MKFKIDTRRKPFLKGDTDKDGCHTPFWKNQLRYARNILRFTLIYSVLHLFYHVVISFLIPDDPFRASSGSKRSPQGSARNISYQYCIATSARLLPRLLRHYYCHYWCYYYDYIKGWNPARGKGGPLRPFSDPFRALSGSKRSKRVNAGVCEEHFLPVLHKVEAVGYVSGNNRGWQSRQRIRTRRKKAPRRSQRQWRPQRQRPGCGRPVKEATSQSTRS